MPLKLSLIEITSMHSLLIKIIVNSRTVPKAGTLRNVLLLSQTGFWGVGAGSYYLVQAGLEFAAILPL